MGKKLFILIGCIAFLMLCSYTIFGQQGILLPQKQIELVHDEDCDLDHGGDTCTCGNVHVSGPGSGWAQLPQIIPYRYSLPGLNDVIDVPDNVGGTFGAGESSVVQTVQVIWPIPRPAANVLSNNSILIGSDYSKNAVISVYDNDGQVSGGLDSVRVFNYSHGTQGAGVHYDDPSQPAGAPPVGDWYLDPATNTSISNTGTLAYRVYAQSISYQSNSTMDTIHNLNSLLWANSPPVGAATTRIAKTDGNRPANTDTRYPNTEGWGSTANTPSAYPGTYMGYIMRPFISSKVGTLTTYTVIIHNHVGTVGYSDEGLFTFTGEEADTLYTSTRLGKDDDGKDMLVSIPNSFQDGSATYQNFVDKVDDDYIRPTTVLLSEVNELNEIEIRDVMWYALFKYGNITTREVTPFRAFNASGCSHYSGWISFYQNNAVYDSISVFDPTYGTAGTYPSGRYVDAAVRLLDNADVHVSGSVIDATSTFKSINTEGTTIASPQWTTDAMLVLPGIGNTNNFRFHVDGNVIINHYQDDGDYDPTGNNPLTDGWLYSDHTSGVGPGDPFPIAQPDTIYLPTGTELFTEVTNMKWNYAHPREPLTLTSQPAPTNGSRWMPYRSTYGSVYGVNGSFYPGLSFISTRSDVGLDTTSIIKIGTNTNNQDSLQIFSSGMLKNYRVEDGVFANILNVGNMTDLKFKAPEFHLSNAELPLYIINDGDGDGDPYCGGINFNFPGVDSINSAILHAEAGGDLHIQAIGYVQFLENDNLGTTRNLNFTLQQDNEIKILSDKSYIRVQNDNMWFRQADLAHLTIWANGADAKRRGATDLDCSTGAVLFEGNVDLSYSGGTNTGSGLAFIKSEFDDVLVGLDGTGTGDFAFTNTRAQAESGELMVQAGQDIRIEGTTTLTQDGQRSMLFEAQKTIAFGGDFLANLGGRGSTDPDSIMRNGDLTIKAGYPGFLPTADVYGLTGLPNWALPTGCVDPGYENRMADQDAATTGGDIWFGGNVTINVTPEIADSVDTYIRAYNSIYMDGDFRHTLARNSTDPKTLIDTTLTFAETGNVEAIIGAKFASGGGDSVKFDVSAIDSVYFLMQAGNTLGVPCIDPLLCYTDPALGQWYGNILFGNDKTFTINHEGRGPTLISAARDIENQVGADVTFNYQNSALNNNDDMLITAGRHIETHAPYVFNFNFPNQFNITNDITMRAGHQSGCVFVLPKTTETASNLAYNVATSNTGDNVFAQGGSGQGSILMFRDVIFNYSGQGRILMTAEDGNIESDPYLHGGYPSTAPLVFNHDGEGNTEMRAIDIRLHDRLEYNGSTRNNQNGSFTMHAFDSILTRVVRYENIDDAGNALIQTDKMKAGINSRYNVATGGPGIHQGHIVLGYGADDDNFNLNDTISFNFMGNLNTNGANLFILAGDLGFDNNQVTGKANKDLFANHPNDRGKGYGGNITFDFMQITMGLGNGSLGGSTLIRTQNGNIWGKDSLQYRGINGNLEINAGLGSVEDTLHAVRWTGFPNQSYIEGAGNEDMLNTLVPRCCPDEGEEWRTGNIILKGGSVDFSDYLNPGGDPGKGNVTFRTQEGFIDVYDKFTASNMTGHLLKYAGSSNSTIAKRNEWGDLSERDFQYTPTVKSGSVFFGADDNIMLNYGYSNALEPGYMFYNDPNPGIYDVLAAGIVQPGNPFYPATYNSSVVPYYAKYDVNTNGYLWYKYKDYNGVRKYHYLYRGCLPLLPNQTGSCYPWEAGDRCRTIDNGARPLMFNFDRTDAGIAIESGGLAIVAANYIDMFTQFTYRGGTGTGLHSVPGMSSLKGESVAGWGLYIKSTFDGISPEKRRLTCEQCGIKDQLGGWMEKPYITFHDDASIRTHAQKSWIEAPLVEFFGNAELDADTLRGTNTSLTVKADSLVFHHDVTISGTAVHLLPLTTNYVARQDMRYGVINDIGDETKYYGFYGRAISMPDRMLPVLELGYQRCYEPTESPNLAPNRYSDGGGEATPTVGGSMIVSFKHGFALPIYNTVVANHARISFTTLFHPSGDYINATIRTDLLRIRNKVEFYTDPTQPDIIVGTLGMTSNEQMESVGGAGIYPHHLHMEPGSELSLPGEDMFMVKSTTTVGGYGEIHENVHVDANGIIAPGYASLMEYDCQTGFPQGRLSIHNLYMDKDAVMRISLGTHQENCQWNPDTRKSDLYCTQTDTLYVQDSIFFFGKIPLYILPETDYIEPGCYLFLMYNDLDASVEYVNNLVLMNSNFGEYHFALDKSERGRVYLCVSELPTPVIQRYIHIHAADGVTTDPVAEIYHYAFGHDDFTFTATYANSIPLEVLATGYYSQTTLKLPATYLFNGTYQYTIRQVVQPWDVYFGEVDTEVGDVGNAGILSQRVWSYRNTLFINVDKEDIVSIYNVTGVLYQKLEIPAGLQKLTLERGIYMVTLKNGSVHKIIIN